MRTLVFDLDGTLLNGAHQLSAETIDVLNQIRTRGVTVLLASGRSTESMLPYYNQLQLSTPLISYNGARILYPDGRVTESRLEAEIVPLLVHLSRRLSCHLNLYGDGLWYSEAPESEEAVRYGRLAGLTVTPVAPKDFPHLSAIKGLLIASPEQLHRARGALESSTLYQRFALTSSMPRFLEVLPRGVNKGVALQEVLSTLGLSSDEVIAFGDGLNDLELLTVAGRGVAMENAHAALKACADECAPRHDEDGIARYLRQLYSI
ncbi:MAG: Cof-type HAD-IIB family hydrolase [Myxococcota bacterium]|nr:Cof-type HAD-IIB family hydrolase [Myxococcota bacterium]